jgi:glycosyltransferase involved in cell wall biosynthesis
MAIQEKPLVSVLTPVYNGEAFLVDCIESVLRQSYTNFEYIIVNNCSTDGSLEIARNYALKDSRIRVHNNDEFLAVIANHNAAFRLMSDSAVYCKVVSADDFIFPECLTQMVDFGERHPGVGIIGSYQLSGSIIRWQGFEYPRAVFSGREVCRRVFLGHDQTFGFGSPTSIMYRADSVREHAEFYPNPSPHSDTSACFRALQTSDFGFVYEVLSYERVHQATQSSTSAEINRYASATLNDLLQYGCAYLNPSELDREQKKLLAGYYRFLAIAYFTRRGDTEFWKYHKSRLEELHHPFSGLRLAKAAVKTLWHESLNPRQAFSKLRKRLPSARLT